MAISKKTKKLLKKEYNIDLDEIDKRVETEMLKDDARIIMISIYTAIIFFLIIIYTTHDMPDTSFAEKAIFSMIISIIFTIIFVPVSIIANEFFKAIIYIYSYFTSKINQASTIRRKTSSYK